MRFWQNGGGSTLPFCFRLQCDYFHGCTMNTELKERSAAVYYLSDKDTPLLTLAELAELIDSVWLKDCLDVDNKFVVFTGGEPLLQLDEHLLGEVKIFGFYIAVETNGTCLAPPGIDWVCMSPKSGAELKLTSGDELKLVFPQPNLHPTEVENLDFDRFFLQPMDGPDIEMNTKDATAYCLNNPQWELSLQTHKLLGIP